MQRCAKCWNERRPCEKCADEQRIVDQVRREGNMKHPLKRR